MVSPTTLCAKKAAPFAVMVLVECGDVVLTTLSKAAMNGGMSNFIFIFYYNALGAFILLFYYLYHTIRAKGPPLTLSLLCKFFVLGLLGMFLVQAIGFTGIKYSSPTLAAAMGNLSPLFIFVLAVIFRMENADIRSSSCRAKILGTLVAVLGALAVTLYKGPPVFLDDSTSKEHQVMLPLQLSNWVLGGLLLFITYILVSAWYVGQTMIVKEYPEIVIIVFFSSLFGAILCGILAVIVERSPTAWTLNHGMEIIAIVYAAIYNVALRFSAVTWCLNEKGPLFVAMFKPLLMVIAVIFGVAFLGDILHIGSVIGAIIITGGFYTVMWGQAREKEMAAADVHGVESSTQSTPLLQNRQIEAAA